MIQKATWIIPGILVTLLLGLLWAMPAFAAEAGEISFLDARGDDDEISFVSLNGDAASGGFWIQVNDSDLDPVVSVSITNDNNDDDTDDVYEYIAVMPIGTPTLPTIDRFEGESGYTWHDVQDNTNDGIVDNRDFKAIMYSDPAAKDGGTKTTLDDVAFTYDRSNGMFAFLASREGTAHEIQFKVKKRTILGARAATDQTATFEQDVGTDGQPEEVVDTDLDTAFNAGETTAADPSDDFVPDETPILGDNTALSWVELLSSKIRDLTTRAVGDHSAVPKPEGVAKIESEMAALIEAYNKGDSAKALSVSVAATTESSQLAGEAAATFKVTGASVTISNNPVDANPDVADNQITKDTVCVGLVQKATPTLPTGTTAPVAADYDCDIAPVTTGVVIYDASAVVVEVKYNGSAATIYDATGRVGDDEDDLNRVTVDSTGASQSISVLLNETGSATGIFGTNIMICTVGTGEGQCSSVPSQEGEAGDGTGMIMIPVEAAGDTITVSYRDGSPRGTRRASIALDPSGPSFNNMSPASGTAGREDEPTVSFEAVDGESGLSDDEDDADSVYVIAALYDVGDDESFDEVVYIRDDLDADEVTNGFAASVTIDEGNKVANPVTNDRLDAGDRDEYEIRWWAAAVDAAGNVGVSDNDSDTACSSSVVNAIGDLEFGAAQSLEDATDIVRALEDTINDKTATADATGCDPSVIRVDSANPELSLAETGYYLDGDEEKSASTTSIVARFSEPLDCDTVSADDFEVDGAAPNAATCDGMNVYLEVDELDSNDTPDVSVAEGAVTDQAGNAIGADQEVESKDVIPAAITVTVTGTAEGDRPITTKEITINISSDEQMKGRPSVDIRMIEDDYSLGENLGSDATSTGTANEWSLSKDIGDAGLYNVYVTAEDRAASGLSIAGLRPGEMIDDPKSEDPDDMIPSTTKFTLNADQVKDNKIILFEVDDSIADPVFTPEHDGETDDANTFIRVNFKYEGKEYGLSGDDEETKATDETGTFSTSGEAISNEGGASFDTSGTVTVTSAMFNGEDVTEDVATRDWVLYVFRPGNLTDGDHKLELEVEDAAGNERDDIVLEFSKVAKKPYELSINPGPNLVSFPANPANGDINAVFGGEGNEDILSVLTFENTSGLWMTATKGADGAFMGDLTNINGMNGYWVVSDGIVDISVVLAGSGDVTTTPPHIAVTEGWNLIGVVDTGQRQSHGISTSDYFANVDAQVVYGFDSFDGKLVRLSTAALTAAQVEAKETQDMVETGMGYWVYANEAGIIIP